MRFAAPEHAADVALTSGTYPVVDGAVDCPDELSSDEIGQLLANGFIRAAETPLPSKAAPAAKVTPAVDPAPNAGAG